MKNINNYDLQYVDDCLFSKYALSAFDSFFSEKKLKTIEITNGILLPLIKGEEPKDFYLGGVFKENREIVPEACLLPNRVVRGYDFNPEDAIYNDMEVIFAGSFWDHWGHFIIEQTSRLWYFSGEQNSSLPIVYLANKPLEGNYLEFFELLGINTKRLIWVNKLTKFRKIYVPEASCVVKSFYTKEFTEIFEKIKSKAPVINSREYEKVFFSRRNFAKAKNRDFGQIREIEQFFEKSGYKIISPEKLSLKKQISIFKSCNKAVFVSGTLPHNLLFTSKNIEAIILNRSYIINPYQWLINEAVGVKPLYIDVQISILPQHVGLGPFFFYISDNLIKYAQNNKKKLKHQNITRYLLKYFQNYQINVKHHRTFLPIGIFEYYLKKINAGSFYKMLCYIMYMRCNTAYIMKKISKIKTIIIIKLEMLF